MECIAHSLKAKYYVDTPIFVSTTETKYLFLNERPWHSDYSCHMISIRIIFLEIVLE